MERIVGGVTRVVVGRHVESSVLDDAPPTVVVLCQPGSRHVADAIAAHSSAPVLQMADGEAAKTLASVEAAVEWLANRGVHRDGLVVAVGGGALLDAAGFIASVYLRGVAVRYLPTTLLAAVDASIGGKNGINVAGKNLIGTFTHPERVIVDLAIIEATPAELRAEGMAEVIKAGAIGDPVLLAMIEEAGLDADLDGVVERAIEVKAIVVDADFTEEGRRAHLNYGHTVGHAVELLAGWSHGRAVAVGMVAAGAASEVVTGFTGSSRIIGALKRVGLPVGAPALSRTAVLDLMARDKKADTTGLRMVLLEDIGRPVVCHVDSATLDAALVAIGIGGS